MAEIADPVVREYYRTDVRNRLAKLRRPDRMPWLPRARLGSTRGGQRASSPCTRCRGAAGGQRSEGSRQERGLLGALIERPACFTSWPRTRRPCRSLIRTWRGCAARFSMRLPRCPGGVDPAVEDALAGSDMPADPPLKHAAPGASGAHRPWADGSDSPGQGPGGVRNADREEDGWVGQWRRAARHLSQLSADPEELRQAEQALAEDMNEENLRRLQAILDRMRRDALSPGAT